MDEVDATESEFYVPGEILTAFTAESRAMGSSVTYDPTYGDLVAMFDIQSRNKAKARRAMAHASGTSLLLSFVDPSPTSIHKDDTIPSLIPTLSGSAHIDLGEPIKQVVPTCIYDNINTILRYLLVRTSRHIKVMYVCYNTNIIGRVVAATEAEYVDVAFNPWNHHQFAAITAEGLVSVHDIGRDHKLATVFQHDEPSDELSKWRRVAWRHAGAVLVFSRAECRELVVGQPPARTIISAGTWLSMRDYVGVDASTAFLLTSKEVVWVDPTSMKRLVAWKHFLDATDPSLRMAVCRVSDAYVVTVYTRVSPVVIAFTFGHDNDMPCVLRDPYILELSFELAQLMVVPLAECYSTVRDDEGSDVGVYVFELSTSHRLRVSLYHYEEGYKMDTQQSQAADNMTPEADAMRYFTRFTKADVEGLARHLHRGEPSNVVSLEEFASKMSVQTPTDTRSLMDVGHVWDTDPGHFDLRLRQAAAALRSQHLALKSSPVLGIHDVTATAVYHALLEKYSNLPQFNNDTLTATTALLLAASANRIVPNNKEVITDSIASDDVKLILDDWESGTATVRENAPAPTQTSLSQAPRINVSQPLVPKHSQPKRPHPLASLPVSSQVQPLQLQRLQMPLQRLSQRPLQPRKKKRRGGFA